MKVKEILVTSELFCVHCASDTLHLITYVNTQISHIRCETCSQTYDVHVDLKHELYSEFIQRIKTKPSRITQEFKASRNYLLKSFPYRLVNKPRRLYKEVKETKRIFSKYIG